MYPLRVCLILGGMLFFGAFRSVGAKMLSQVGFKRPQFITLLYLLGQCMALGLYFIQKKNKERDMKQKMQDAFEANNMPVGGVGVSHSVNDGPNQGSLYGNEEQQLLGGSRGDLGDASKEAAGWVHKIPWYLQPVIPGLFNMGNAALKWLAYTYVAASIAEMLISGSELVMSVIAARFLRKRQVSRMRWLGTFIVTCGLIMVGGSNYIYAEEEDESDGESGQTIGILLVLGQSVLSVLQDLSEEMFMQESAFPPLLLLGMEGMFGLIIGSIIYFPLSSSVFDEPLSEIFSSAELGDPDIGWLAVGFTLIVLLNGMFGIMTTGATSSMTRNVWKNARTALVWILGLIVFYGSGNDTLGEGWSTPGSFMVLGGFFIMVFGIYTYYNAPKKDVPPLEQSLLDPTTAQ